MPQLDPAPWLSTLIMSWLLFLGVLPYKVLTHKFFSQPSHEHTQTAKGHKMAGWSWKWQ